MKKYCWIFTENVIRCLLFNIFSLLNIKIFSDDVNSVSTSNLVRIGIIAGFISFPLLALASFLTSLLILWNIYIEEEHRGNVKLAATLVHIPFGCALNGIIAKALYPDIFKDVSQKSLFENGLISGLIFILYMIIAVVIFIYGYLYDMNRKDKKKERRAARRAERQAAADAVATETATATETETGTANASTDTADIEMIERTSDDASNDNKQ